MTGMPNTIPAAQTACRPWGSSQRRGDYESKRAQTCSDGTSYRCTNSSSLS